ncbi:MAG TPA: hypothetical protein VJX67_08745, partial [Blastocatellia bacterium]|nr:hypothetical protein [Blastocatellia bacterium]
AKGDKTGVPQVRNGKTVTTAMVFGCNTDGDGVPDLFITLTNVNPKSANWLQGTFATIAATPGTAFPIGAQNLACCGGFGTLTATTTFTKGDNNIFNLVSGGGFTLSTTCVIDVGVRAPVVISVTGSSGDCSVPQDLRISGSCFILPNGTPNVTSVFAVESGNPSNVIQATNFVILKPTDIDALFNFGSANAGKTFLIFASGPFGVSQNLTSPASPCLPNGGNQQGILVTFTCITVAPPPPQCPVPPPTVVSCDVTRNGSGVFVLTVVGSGVLPGATITVNGGHAKKVSLSGQTFTLKGKVCKLLPGPIVITNPQSPTNAATCPTASAPVQCNKTCATQ